MISVPAIAKGMVRDTVGKLVGRNSFPWATARLAIGVGPEARREIESDTDLHFRYAGCV